MQSSRTRGLGAIGALAVVAAMLCATPVRADDDDGGGMVIGGPLNGTILPGSRGDMVIGGPLNGTILPGAKGGMAIGGPLNGSLDPLIERTFGIMFRKGLIPEPPKELQGMKLKVEYSSIMSQAQKLLGITSVDRMMGFVGNLSAVSAEVMDNINTDEVTSAYADMLGVCPKMVRSKDEVMRIRQARAQQIAQQQAIENSAIQAKNAEILSKTDVQRPSALTTIAQQMVG